MQDPLPENVEGSKRVAHTVEHHINWSHVALGVAVIVVVLYLGSVGGESAGEVERTFNTHPSERRRSSES